MQFRRFVNYELSATHEDVEYAHRLGYQIHLLDAVVCETVGEPFTDFITEMYSARNSLKREMKQYPAGSDDYTRCNILQTVAKLLMNSTYGKFAWASEHDISNYVSADTQFLLDQYR